MIDFNVDYWPEVPNSDRPKKLYVSHNLSAFEKIELLQKGWDLVDVRLLPNSSDADRTESLKAHLEGVRLGSIEVDSKKQKFLELEAAVYGMKSAKFASTEKRTDLEQLDIKQLLDLSSTKAFRGPWNSGATLKEVSNQVGINVKRKGRPRGTPGPAKTLSNNRTSDGKVP